MVHFLARAIVVTAIALVFAGCERNPQVGREEFREATLDGDVIIQAIIAHRDKRGTIPASLEELVPEYMTAIPHERAPFGEWVLLSATPGAPIDDEFALALIVDRERVHSQHERLVCYVEVYTDRTATWVAEPVGRSNTDAMHLRRAAFERPRTAAGDREATEPPG